MIHTYGQNIANSSIDRCSYDCATNPSHERLMKRYEVIEFDVVADEPVIGVKDTEDTRALEKNPMIPAMPVEEQMSASLGPWDLR
jgi:hypothetical protein